MAPRIVVSLHLRGAGVGPSVYLRRALAAKKRAEALGAALSAWGPDSLAFDFGVEEIEQAVDVALATFEDAPAQEPRFSAGIASGELDRLPPHGSNASLACGDALSTAWRLARSADPGEVLIDEQCPRDLADVVRTKGERRLEAESLTALVLDTRHPFRRDTLIDELADDDGTKVRVTVPPLPPILGLSRDLWDRAPSPIHALSSSSEKRPSEPPPTLRNLDSTRDEASHTEPPSGAVVPRAPAVEPSVVVPPPRMPPARSAPSVPPPSMSAFDSDVVPPHSASRISWPGGSDEYQELAAAARQALLKGNVAELERLSDELKSRGEPELAERMAGFVAWNRGAKAEGLRKLRAAADAETRPRHRVRALLAYGVALAASGRTDAALLAALGALARAREINDRQGEHVCARFLARLSSASGYHRAAATWAAVAEAVSG